YVADPYHVLNVNVNGTQNVLRAAYKHRRRMVFTSTSEVYGRNPAVPWSEDADRVLGPTTIDRWCYATSKAAAEHFCLAYRRHGRRDVHSAPRRAPDRDRRGTLDAPLRSPAGDLWRELRGRPAVRAGRDPHGAPARRARHDLARRGPRPDHRLVPWRARASRA